jgi:O-antigen ligase
MTSADLTQQSPARTGYWRGLAGALLVAAALLWLLLTIAWRACPGCGATPATVAVLTPGVVAAADSPLFDYSPGWQVSAPGAGPAEPADPFGEPAGVITFAYTGDSLWLLLAPGDYWAYLYATVDGAPANRLPLIAGNLDNRGAAAGYTTLLAPELAEQAAHDQLRWIEVQRAPPFREAGSFPEGVHTARLEFWRGWGQAPLRAVAVDPAPDALLIPNGPRALLAAPAWPGVLLLLVGLWLIGWWLAVATRQRTVHVPLPPTVALPFFRRLVEASEHPAAWMLLAAGATLAVAGTVGLWWPVTLVGIALIGMAGLLRPTLWFAALLFALPAAYALPLPLLPGRALGIIDVGLAGGVAVLVGRRVLLWLAGVEPFTAQKAVARVQQVTMLLLALVVAWALVASVDVRYPALALREWRTLFLNTLIFALLLLTLLHRSRQPARERWLLVAGWTAGASAVALIGLWGFATGSGFVSAAEGVRRVQALYDSANNLALYLDRTAPVTLALVLLLPGRGQRLLWALLAAPQALAWLLTFSKGTLLLAAPAALLVLGVGGFWLLRRQGRPVTRLALLAALLVIGAGMLAPFAGAERFQRLLDFEQGTGFLRMQLWRSAWQMALDHPLRGVGPDQFLYHYRSDYLLPTAWQEPNLNHPHNVLLDWWTRLGLPGLVLGMSWLGAGVLGIWRWLQGSVAQPREAALALGCLAAAAAGLAHGLIDVSYALPELMLVWVLIFHLGAEAEMERG